MKTGKAIHHDLHTLFEAGALGRLSDGDLLERFIARRDEPAFEAIIRRHGPMVLGVCRRVLRDHHDAEDAFQATFLVLARRAKAVRPAEMLPNWLYGVAHRTAIKARALNARRRSRERQVTTMPEPEIRSMVPRDDLAALLDRELSRLPRKYRVPVILCDLEGLGHREAAAHLGWPVGTVSGRLSRARAMLAKRLRRLGLALPAGTLAFVLPPEAVSAGVPALLSRRTIEASIGIAAGRPLAVGMISGPVEVLTDRILGGMKMTRVIATIGAGLAGGVLLFGGLAGHRILSGQTARGVIRPVAQAVAEDAATREARHIRGTWQGVKMEINGKKVPAHEARDLLMIIEGDEIFMKSVNLPGPPGSPRGRGLRFKLDPAMTPRAIDITAPDGQEAGLTSAAIYALENGRLRICIAANIPGKDPGRRPTEFRTREGDGRVLFVLERVGPNGPVEPPPRDATMAGFEKIVGDYERAALEYQNAEFMARTPAERRKVEAEKRPKTDGFAERFLRLAQQRPDTREALFALCWSVVNAPASEPGKQALAILEGGRLANADPGELLQALQAARTIQESRPSPLAPLVLQRVERNLESPAGAGLLTWVCSNYYRSEWPEEPRIFTEAAHHLVDRFADSPGIHNFCECLVSVDGFSPKWAGKYEPHLRMILLKNRDRLVRCEAMFALASVVRGAGEARRDEAASLYESVIKQFGDLSDPRTKHVEKEVIEQAKRELTKIRDRRANRPAPDRGAGR